VQLVAAPCPSATYICNRKAPGPLGVRPQSRNLGVVQLPRKYWSDRAYIGFPFACFPDPAVEAGVVTPLVSVATVIEYEAVLKRAEHLQAARLDAEEVDRFLDDFVAHADQITPHFRTRPSVQDPDDEMFAEPAVNGQADALVTFNLGDYRPADPRTPRLDIPVCRPGDILRRLPWRPSATSRSAFHLP